MDKIINIGTTSKLVSQGGWNVGEGEQQNNVRSLEYSFAKQNLAA